MAGRTAEQGRQNPLRHLGERLFGYGRRFGIQRGSLGEKIEDPFYSDIRLAATLSDNGMRVALSAVTKEEERRIVERLSGQINNGTASVESTRKDIILFFDRQLAQTGMALVHHYGDVGGRSMYQRLVFKYDVPPNLAELDLEEIQRTIDLSIAPIAQEIISDAHTLQSIPYLQRALESRFAYRGSKLGEVREEHLSESGRAISTPYEEFGWEKEKSWLVTTHEEIHNTYETTGFEAINPLAQAATKVLERMAVGPDIDLQIQAEAKSLISALLARPAYGIAKTAQYRKLIDSQLTGRTIEVRS